MELRDDLLKGAEAAAEYLGINARTIYRMAETNEIPVIRKGKLLFFRKSALDAAFMSDFDGGGHMVSQEVRDLIDDARKPREPSCYFADLVPLFQELFEPEPSRQMALVGRIRNLARVGLHDRSMGRGVAMLYGPDDVRKMLFAMELTSMGVAPAKAVEITRDTQLGFSRGLKEIDFDSRRHSKIVVDMGAMREAAQRCLPHMFPKEAPAGAVRSMNAGVQNG